MRLHEALSFLRLHGILGPVSSCVGHVVLAIVTDVEAQNLTQCWMNNEDHVQHAQDIHKLPLHIAIDSQSNCLKLYFIEWQEQFL